MSFAALAIVIGTGTAVVMGGIYLMNDDEELDHLDELGLFLAIGGALCLIGALFYSNALFFAAAGLSGAAAILAGRLLIPILPLAYVGALAVVGLVFSVVLINGLLAIDLSTANVPKPVTQAVSSDVGRDLNKTVLRGTVTDLTSQPVTNAQITLKGPLILSSPATLEVSTNATGAYHLDLQSRGTYELKVAAEGFEPTTKRLVVDTVDMQVQALVLRQKLKFEPVEEVLSIEIEKPVVPVPPPPQSPTPAPPRQGQVSAPGNSSGAPNVVLTPRLTRTATPTRTPITATPVRSVQATATPTTRVGLPSQGGSVPLAPSNPSATTTRTPSVTPTVTVTPVPVVASTHTPTATPTP